MKFGNKFVDKVCLGNTQIKKIYLGDEVLYNIDERTYIYEQVGSVLTINNAPYEQTGSTLKII